MSARTATNEVQTAVYTMLSTDSQLITVLGVTGVYDKRSVPENPPFSYLTLGDFQELPNNALQKRGYNNLMTIHYWTRDLNEQAAQMIVDRLNQLLDQPQVPLSLATHTHVSTNYNGANYLDDPDGLTLHAVVKYKVFTQE